MAQGEGYTDAEKRATKPLEATTSQCEDEMHIMFSKFLESPTWLYPIIRFLGHALRSKIALSFSFYHSMLS